MRACPFCLFLLREEEEKVINVFP